MKLGHKNTSARRIGAFVLTVLMGSLVLLVITGFVSSPEGMANIIAGAMSASPVAGVVVILVMILPFIGLAGGISGLIGPRGVSVHLKGTVLIVGKSSVDLANSPQVWIDESPALGGVVVPHLNARRADGPVIRLPLGTHKGGLPAGDLAALAHAIDAGVRGTTESALQAADTANRLRQWSQGRP
ncbi:MAG TPA: hypothetical protein VGF17_08340 [Phytomonospora sp.]